MSSRGARNWVTGLNCLQRKVNDVLLRIGIGKSNFAFQKAGMKLFVRAVQTSSRSWKPYLISIDLGFCVDRSSVLLVFIES